MSVRLSRSAGPAKHRSESLEPSWSPRMRSASAKTLRASGEASSQAFPMPTAWAPWPGQRTTSGVDMSGMDNGTSRSGVERGEALGGLRAGVEEGHHLALEIRVTAQVGKAVVKVTVAGGVAPLLARVGAEGVEDGGRSGGGNNLIAEGELAEHGAPDATRVDSGIESAEHMAEVGAVPGGVQALADERAGAEAAAVGLGQTPRPVAHAGDADGEAWDLVAIGKGGHRSR